MLCCITFTSFVVLFRAIIVTLKFEFGTLVGVLLAIEAWSNVFSELLTPGMKILSPRTPTDKSAGRPCYLPSLPNAVFFKPLSDK